MDTLFTHTPEVILTPKKTTGITTVFFMVLALTAIVIWKTHEVFPMLVLMGQCLTNGAAFLLWRKLHAVKDTNQFPGYYHAMMLAVWVVAYENMTLGWAGKALHDHLLLR